MSAVGSGQEGWRPHEEEYRRDEVASQKRLSKAQRIVTWTTVVATLVAIAAATLAVVQSRDSVNVAEQGIQRQSEENRLATAVTAIGGQTVAERVAGVELLRRHVDERLAEAASTALNSWDRQDARDLYTSALVILANYLPRGPLAANAPCVLPRPLDAQYAAKELKQLLDSKAEFMALEPNSKPPAVDLSYVEMCNQSWPGIRFDGLSGAYLLKIDLRGSNLQMSQWGTAFLAGAKLQCADLRGANLSQATLTGADLRGANVAGAQFPSTLQAAQLVGAVRVPTGNWDPTSCLSNKAYRGPLQATPSHG